LGSKVGEKPVPLPPFLQFFFPSLSSSIQPPTKDTTSFFIISSTTGSQHNHPPTTKSHRRFLSPLCSPSRFLLLLLLPLPPATISATASATVLTPAAPRLDQRGLYRRQIAPSLRCCQPGCCVQNEFSFCMQHD